MTQLWLVVTGNFAWLNWVTIVIAFSAIGDAWHRLGIATRHRPAPWLIDGSRSPGSS